MNLRKQKNLSSRALGISKKRIKFITTNPDNKKELKELISREGVKDLIENKIIIKLNKVGISRTRANKILSQKKKGRRSGHGSRKGTANARFNTKDKWIIKIRALRNLLKSFKNTNKLKVKDYRDLYRKAKGNFFRNKRHMMLFIDQNNLLKDTDSGVKSKYVSKSKKVVAKKWRIKQSKMKYLQEIQVFLRLCQQGCQSFGTIFYQLMEV